VPCMKTTSLLLTTSLAACLVGCTTKPGQSLLENKAVVLRSEKELWSNGNLAVADELYSPDFVCHFIAGPDWRGLEGIKGEVRQHRISFPDWNERVDDIVAEGDRGVIRFTSTGTQRGEFGGIAPTGSKVTIQEVAIYRLAGGKIAEQWGFPDVHGLMEQLGASSAGKRQAP
jgi:predicted ester cyclase